MCAAELLQGNQHNIRVITDQIRYEDQGNGLATAPNVHAGEDVTRWIRSQGVSKVPILVHASDSSVGLTDWVKVERMTGSTSSFKMLNEYVEGLKSDSRSKNWARFDSRVGEWPGTLRSMQLHNLYRAIGSTRKIKYGAEMEDLLKTIEKSEKKTAWWEPQTPSI